MTGILDVLAAEVAARLADLSGRMLRFEPIDPAELAEFERLRDRFLDLAA